MAPDTNNISTKDIFTNGLLDALRRFNAKERCLLSGYFLGNREFRPGRECLEKLEHKLKIPEDIFVKASNIFCAMDYHLDWLNGALELAFLPARRRLLWMKMKGNIALRERKRTLIWYSPSIRQANQNRTILCLLKQKVSQLFQTVRCKAR